MQKLTPIDQLDLFEDPEQTRFRTEMARSVEILRKDVESYKASCDKVRKGLFARYDQLANDYAALMTQFNELKSKQVGA